MEKPHYTENIPHFFPWTPKGGRVPPLDFPIWVWMDNMLAQYRDNKEIKNEDDLASTLSAHTNSTIPHWQNNRLILSRVDI